MTDETATPATPAEATPVTLRVDCVIRTERVSPHHRIRAIGGRGRDGASPWRLSEEAALAAIEGGRAAFYVEWPQGHRIDLVVGQGLGKAFLKGASDVESSETLLALPDCD